MKKFRYAIEAAFLSFLFSVFKHMNVQRASDLGGMLARSVGPLLPPTQTALRNLNLAFPEKTEAERKAILIGMWDNLGRIIAEYPHLDEIIMKRTEIVGEENLDSIGKHKPCVVIAAHLGNWELGPFYFNYRKRWPMSSIYRAPNNPYVEKIITKLRTPGLSGTYIAKSQQGVRDMVRVLKRGERLGNLIDQKYNQGLHVPFLGHPAPTSQAFSQLAQKFSCPILPLQIERLPGSRFRITLHKPFYTDGRSDEDVTIQAHDILEGWIRKHPEQWLWIHRRWGKNLPSA